MFHTKLTLAALLTVGLTACTQDKPNAPAPEPAVKAAEKAETPTPVATAPAGTAQGEAEGEEGYSCDQGAEEHAEGGGCNKWDEAAAEVTKRTVPDDAVWVALNVDGMTCGGCERRIQAKVGELDGVVAVEASSELSRVRIAFAKGASDETAARERIAALGYKVR